MVYVVLTEAKVGGSGTGGYIPVCQDVQEMLQMPDSTLESLHL
ncbi:hypothetical protein [Bacteroides thetaiotaomicron]